MEGNRERHRLTVLEMSLREAMENYLGVTLIRFVSSTLQMLRGFRKSLWRREQAGWNRVWDFLCRALSESKLKAQLELSAAGNIQINISKNKGG